MNDIIIERMPQFEEKLGIRIENLSIKAEGNAFYIYGDFYMENTKNFSHMRITATIYDENNNILDTSSAIIFLNEFLGFETFEILSYPIETHRIKKIRLYPKTQ